MKRNRLYGFSKFSMVLLIILSACAKENECSKLSDEYFPNRVGNWWIYDRFDSLAMERTTLRVEIIRDSIWKDNQSYRMWIYSKSNIYDTLFVRTTKDSVLFYRYLEGIPMEVMPIPVLGGQSWVHPFWVRDSTRVLSRDTVVVSNQSYGDAYLIHRHLFAFNDYLTDERWFVPHLGIVRLENWHYLFGWISKENWYLKDFGFTD